MFHCTYWALELSIFLCQVWKWLIWTVLVLLVKDVHLLGAGGKFIRQFVLLNIEPDWCNTKLAKLTDTRSLQDFFNLL